jgi:acylaminoacyl-peptidase
VYRWRLKEPKLEKLSSADVSVLSPRLSPDKTKLVWLENRVGGPHKSCSKLMLLSMDTSDISCVVESVHTPNGGDFPGLYVDALPTRCWSQDGSKVIFSSIWRSLKEILCVDVMLGTVSKISPGTVCVFIKVLD